MIEAVKEEVDRYPELGTQHQESQPCPKKLKTVVALHETKSAQPEPAAGTHNLELEPQFVSQDSPEPAAGTQDSDSDTYLEWMKRSSIHHLQGKRKL
jgi:hypothetical protein